MATSKRADQPNSWEYIFLVEQRYCAAAATGHATSYFQPMAEKCTCPSVHARMCQRALRKPIVHGFSSSTPMARIEKFTRGEFATQSGSRSVPAAASFG